MQALRAGAASSLLLAATAAAMSVALDDAAGAAAARGAAWEESLDAQALAEDDQCGSSAAPGEEACALVALQRRGAARSVARPESSVALATDAGEVAEVAAAAEASEERWWPFKSSKEQCCFCKGGASGWSADGSCSVCNGQLLRKQGVMEHCTKGSKNFKGEEGCNRACQLSASWDSALSKEVSLNEGALAQDERSGPQVLAETEGSLTAEAASRRWSSWADNVEKCCKCKDGSIFWSGSGQCSACPDEVVEKAEVFSRCSVSSPDFLGKAECNQGCKLSFKMGYDINLVETADVPEGSHAEDEGRGANKTLARGMATFDPSSMREKCCQCEDGHVLWSASGLCSRCSSSGAPQNVTRANAFSKCMVSSPNFLGMAECDHGCKMLFEMGWRKHAEEDDDDDDDGESEQTKAATAQR